MKMLLDISSLCFTDENKKDVKSDSREKSTTSLTSKCINSRFPIFLMEW